MLRKIDKGSKIGIIAPGFKPHPEKLQNGIQYLRNYGFSVICGKSVSSEFGYLAGSDSLRVDDIHQMYTDPEVAAIVCARGGWGSMRLLDKLDFNIIKNNPKVLIGYSDITTLQLAMWTKIKLPSLSGPMAAVDMSGPMPHFTEKHFWGQINNQHPSYQFVYETGNTQNWTPGQASGILMGGCLSMIIHLLGTPYSPDYSKSILFIEDVGEEAYRIDRYLAQLKQAGILDKIQGIIIGNFKESGQQSLQSNNFSIEDIFRQYLTDAPYPVIFNFPYGHDDYKFSLPIGAKIIINTSENKLEIANIFR